MSGRSVDPAYLRYQYGTAEKLKIRIASHERYSERALDFRAWVLQWLDPAPGADGARCGLRLRRIPPGLGSAWYADHRV